MHGVPLLAIGGKIRWYLRVHLTEDFPYVDPSQPNGGVLRWSIGITQVFSVPQMGAAMQRQTREEITKLIE